MLYRKISKTIEEYFVSGSNKIMLVEGAHQIGKTFIIRYVGQKHFQNYIEINMAADKVDKRAFANVNNIQDFYFQVSMLAGKQMKEVNNTLIFIDEIQEYPQLLTLLKFLREDNRYTYIASGSLLGLALATTSSIPMGSIQIVKMYPLDLEEFCYANGFNATSIKELENHYKTKQSLDENTHNKLLDMFKKYLIVGGLPDAVNSYLASFNIHKIRDIQSEIYRYYGADASKYDQEHHLKIQRIYELIPSTLENKKKRIVLKQIENKKSRASEYKDEFDYLINSGIALEVKAIANPVFPLLESASKNLLKLYLNDVGILTGLLYQNNIRAVLDDNMSINLGGVYESIVAQELKAHGYQLFYYDNRLKGEVDFIINDYASLSILPIEVKSGKDYTVHSALDNLLNSPDYNVKQAIVFSNNREIKIKNKVLYLPIYDVMFLNN